MHFPGLLMLITCSALCVSGVSMAVQLEDDTPDDEAGLSAESAPANLAKLVPLIRVKEVRGEPVIDGSLEDPFWQKANAITIDYELFPVRLAAADVKTQCFIGITDSHIYVAFDAYDPAIKELRTAKRERDGIKSDDYVAIVVDPDGLGLRKYEFRVNPSGAISDVMQDTNSDRYIYDWDAEWKAESTIHDEGFRVEVAIPRPSTQLFSQKPGSHPVVLLKRHYPRRVDRTLGSFFFLDLQALPPPPRSDEVKSHSAGSQPRLKVVPHLVYDRDEERDIGESRFEQVEDKPITSMGGYARYNLSEDHSLGVTVNPNYAEIEADIARDSINNTFDPYQPEKRPLFIEVGEYFQTLEKVVYTRNVVQPSVSMDHLWSGDKGSSGLFAAYDHQTRLVMPDNLGSDTVTLTDPSQSVASNYEHQFGKRSVGMLGTFRSGEGYHNGVISLNGTGNLGVDDKVRAQLMYSDTRYPERFANDLCEVDGCTTIAPDSDCELGQCATTSYVERADFENKLQGYNFQLNYKHDGPSSLYWANLYDVSPDFRADMGFIRRADYRAINVAYGRKWYFRSMEKDESQSRIRGYLVGLHTRSHSDNEDLETSGSAWLEYRGSYQSLIRVGRWHRNRAVNRIDQSSLDAGTNAPLFDERYWQWYSQVSPFPSWTLHLDGRWGRWRIQITWCRATCASLFPSWNTLRARST